MNNKLIPLIMTLVVGIILTGSLLMPVLDSARYDLGTPVTYSNPINDGNYYMRELQEGDTLVVTVTDGQTTTVHVNGEQITTIEGSVLGGYHDLIMSNVFTCNTGSSTSGLQIASYNSTSVGYTSSTTITYSNGTITQQNDGATAVNFEGVTWGYIVCNEPDAGYYESVRTGATPFYMKDDNDVVCAGVYTTGDNDTYYWYKDGVTNVAQDFTASSEVTKTLVNGTQDIYSGTIDITVGGESFVPYRVLIPLEVEGHATAGAAYSLLGAIPVIVIVALLMVAIGAIAYRRAD